MKNLFYSFALLFSFSVSSFATNIELQKQPCDIAFLGIHSDHVSPKKARILGFENPHGVYVTQVLPNTAAEKAGLQAFDYIHAIGMYELTDNQGLSSILSEFDPGDEAKIHFVRQGKEMSVDVQFGDKGSWRQCASPAVKKSFLGVQKTGKSEGDPIGIKVNIIDNTTAKEIGLQDGDIITEIDDIRMVDWNDLTTMMKNKQADENIKITFVRNGKTQSADGNLHGYRNSMNNRWQKSEEEWKEFGERQEEKWERFGERMEDFGDRMEEEADELADEIEERIQEYFDNREQEEEEEEEEIDENDDNRSGFNEDIMINRNPRQRMDTPAPRPDVSNLSANIQEASANELSSLNTGSEALAGMDNNLQIENITFTPNTQSGMFELIFELPKSGNTLVQLFNNSGRMIYEYELGSFSGEFKDEIDVSQNAPGIYFLIVKQGIETATRKIRFDLQ